MKTLSERRETVYSVWNLLLLNKRISVVKGRERSPEQKKHWSI